MHRSEAQGEIPSSPKDIKIHLVCYEDINDWILGKFAQRLLAGVRGEGFLCGLSNLPDPTADINHHICYTLYDGNRTTADTLMITHVNTDEKLQLLRRQMDAVEMGICMSAETMEMLASKGLPRHKLCFINPAHDGTVEPRKICIGITHRIYADGRKGEQVLVDLAAEVSPDDFRFRIMGSGWEPVVSQLQSLGFEVDLSSEFERRAYDRLFASIDYYLYFAMDEGSMGFVDALAAGVPTIVTAQGFHLDAPEAITHRFSNAEQLAQIFRGIAAEKRRRQAAVKDWTWHNYARQHLLVWNYILSRSANPAPLEPIPPHLKKMGVNPI